MEASARKLIAKREYFSLLPLLPVLKYLGSVLIKFSVVLQVLAFWNRNSKLFVRWYVVSELLLADCIQWTHAKMLFPFLTLSANLRMTLLFLRNKTTSSKKVLCLLCIFLFALGGTSSHSRHYNQSVFRTGSCCKYLRFPTFYIFGLFKLGLEILVHVLKWWMKRSL